jgi:UDP-glucuronate 4-epimerase
MNYIISGTAGFIGFHTAQKLLSQGHRVLGIDSISDYYDVQLKKDRLRALGIDAADIPYGSLLESGKYPLFQFARVRVEDKKALSDIFERFSRNVSPIHALIHLAAQAGVRYSLENPQVYIDTNICGFLNILEECRGRALPHLVFASSSSVYGLNAKRPFSPHLGADHPVSLYAATKRSNELLAHTYAHLFGIPVTGLRFFTVYGPWGRPDMAYYKFSKMIMEGKTIEVYNQGEMFRDFSYIDDIAEGIILALNHPPGPSPDFDPFNPDPSCSSAPYKIYNLGNNRSESLNDFIGVLEEVLGKKAVKKYLPVQDGDVLATEADIEDSIRDLKWRPKTNIREGLKCFAEWFLAYHGK